MEAEQPTFFGIDRDLSFDHPRLNEFVRGLMGDELITVPRKTKIFLRGKYFDYPLEPVNAVFGMGVPERARTRSPLDRDVDCSKGTGGGAEPRAGAVRASVAAAPSTRRPRLASRST